MTSPAAPPPTLISVRPPPLDSLHHHAGTFPSFPLPLLVHLHTTQPVFLSSLSVYRGTSSYSLVESEAGEGMRWNIDAGTPLLCNSCLTFMTFPCLACLPAPYSVPSCPASLSGVGLSEEMRASPCRYSFNKYRFTHFNDPCLLRLPSFSTPFLSSLSPTTPETLRLASVRAPKWLLVLLLAFSSFAPLMPPL